MVKVALIGALGRLGKTIVEMEKEVPNIEISLKIGSPRSTLPSALTENLLTSIDLVLDVSTPAALEENLPSIISTKKPLIVGSTGHTEKQMEALQKAATSIPLLISPNFSPGIGFIQSILTQVPKGKYLLEEKHRAGKKDAPSGTALMLAALLKDKVEITSIREGEFSAEHRLVVSTPYEELVISHKVLDKMVFALGALRACHFLYNKPPGLYSRFYD